MENNLYNQMSEQAKSALALLLGFNVQSVNDSCCCGFRNRLRGIERLPEGFTIGDALKSYLTAVEMGK